MENKKILMVVPDGVGIRNYLYSDLISKLKQNGYQLILLHNLDQSLIDMVKSRIGIDFDQIQFRNFPETKIQYLLREATTYARLQLGADKFDNPTLLSNSKVGKKGLKRLFFTKIAEILGRSLKKYEGILFFESEIYRYWKSSKGMQFYQELLDQHKPDLIFITHQRVPSLVPLCIAAKSKNIPTVSAIYSWDNLPKARLPIRTDFYAVWSDYMKKEFVDFYPEISDQQLLVTGTPQFDFYKNQDLKISRTLFAEKYGLDPDKKWILFSGDDLVTSPHDPEYLSDVAESVMDHTEIQILFRQVPVEGPDRYLKYIEKFDNITHIPPSWKRGKTWMNFFPMFEDIQLLMNLCLHCETVINIGSTMALDFSYFDKPGIFLAYDTVKDPDWSTKIIYQFQHFRTLNGLDAVMFARSKNELKEKILQAINSPQIVAKDRLKWMRKVNNSDSTASENMLEMFRKLVPHSKSKFDETPLQSK